MNWFSLKVIDSEAHEKKMNNVSSTDEMRSNFSQLLRNFTTKQNKSECKKLDIREIVFNDSAIRLQRTNNKRKVFNYSIEIFIKNFSHYSTSVHFFSCLAESFEHYAERNVSHVKFQAPQKQLEQVYLLILENSPVIIFPVKAASVYFHSLFFFLHESISAATKSEAIKPHKIIHQRH